MSRKHVLYLVFFGVLEVVQIILCKPLIQLIQTFVFSIHT